MLLTVLSLKEKVKDANIRITQGCRVGQRLENIKPLLQKVHTCSTVTGICSLISPGLLTNRNHSITVTTKAFC